MGERLPLIPSRRIGLLKYERDEADAVYALFAPIRERLARGGDAVVIDVELLGEANASGPPRTLPMRSDEAIKRGTAARPAAHARELARRQRISRRQSWRPWAAQFRLSFFACRLEILHLRPLTRENPAARMEGTPKKLYPSPEVHLKPQEIASRASDAYAGLCERFRATGTAVDFDFREHCLQWTSRGDHFTHRLHRYPGRLTPYIPLFFLGVRGVAVSGGSLLDPFAGCGTVLVEAPVHPAHPMRPIGIEINPLARLIAKVKTTPVDPRAVNDAWQRIRARHDGDRSRAGLPAFPNKRHWFTLAVEQRLARVLRAMNGLRDSNLRDFFLVATSSVIRDVSLADPSVSVPVRIDPRRFHDPAVRARARKSLQHRTDAGVLSILDRTVTRNLARMLAWTTAKSVENLDAEIVGEDARTFVAGKYIGRGELANSTSSISGVDLVLTSPPYANAQRYTRSLRLELFVLGYTNDSLSERALDRLQVGTERIPERDWKSMAEATNSLTANRVIELVRQSDAYRAAILGRYVRDMETVVANCYQALKPGGHAVFVIGNNCVRGRVIDNAEVLAELGGQAGFAETLRVRNRIPSRGLLTKRHPTAGVITHEHVVVLRKPLTTSKRR